jgi:hypothetical protein
MAWAEMVRPFGARASPRIHSIDLPRISAANLVGLEKAGIHELSDAPLKAASLSRETVIFLINSVTILEQHPTPFKFLENRGQN